MPKVEIRTSAPPSEYSLPFLGGMLDRMWMSFAKYGKVSKAFPTPVNAIKTLKLKLEEFEKTGNTEFLIDVANYAMIEFMHPAHPKAHYKPTDGSSGRMWNGEVNPTERANDPAEWVKDND